MKGETGLGAMFPIVVQIFASHPVVAARYGQLLGVERDFRLAVREKCIDVGLFDGELPCLEATLTTARLACPSMRPLLLSYPCDEDECLRWMFRGVRGLVDYDHYERELTVAARRLAQGQLHFPAQVISRWNQLATATAQGAPLTRREIEVAGLLSRRLSNKQIGGALGLTERTVKFHVGNILTKLGLGSRFEFYAISFTHTGPTRERYAIVGASR